MYFTCLFCNNSLGANEVIETFPVGRRLAFDQRRGRLWVVCRKCEKWNLTPLEERWEAIETCERMFRDTRKRVSTDQIGLARLPEGLELVRIGEPQRPEFAAWRYGDQFGRRRRRGQIYGVALTFGAVGLFGVGVSGLLLGVSVLGAYNAAQLLVRVTQMGTAAYRSRRVIARLHSSGGQAVVRGKFVEAARLVPVDDAQGWALEVPVEREGKRERLQLAGAEARRAAAALVPHLTPYAGSHAAVQEAVKRVESAGQPEQYLRWLARNLRKQRDYMERKDIVTGKRVAPSHVYDTLRIQDLEACLAVEMAVNEENERIALEGELALLELAWKDAEEIAAIADRLALPPGVESTLFELRHRHSREL